MENLTFEQLPKTVSEILRKLENIERLLLEKSTNQQSTKEGQLLSVKQAAEFLNLAVPTIYSKFSQRELPFMKRSKRLYFSKEELTDYLKKGRQMTLLEIEESANEYLRSKNKFG